MSDSFEESSRFDLLPRDFSLELPEEYILLLKRNSFTCNSIIKKQHFKDTIICIWKEST